MQKILPKNKLREFLLDLTKDYNVVIPVKEGITKYKLIENKHDLDKLYLKDVTLAPAKQFILPENETLLEFKGDSVNQENKKPKKTVIFGLRKCDLNAFLVLDKVMYDENYKKRREGMVLMGLFCENPDEYCFCNSMELDTENIYDLFFYPEKNDYYISVGSDKGKEIVKGNKLLKENKGKEIKKDSINIKKLPDKNIENDYKNKIWKTDADKCLSCAACTAYCPTCNCFDLKDVVEINLKDGKRTRSSASCQLKSFSQVAGGKVFRDTRLAKLKHFIYHKIVYYKKQHNKYMCVGCGRCLRVCPTRIDWVNTINLLKDSKKGGKK
jgi:sulfhydrogenase subunit beta (sulfur reductase)